MLVTTNNDLQVIVGNGTPLASDVLYGGIALDENGRVLTKNKAGAIVVVAEKNEQGTSDKIVKVTSNYTSNAFETVLVDTRANAITITLPSSPTSTDRVRIVDLYRNASTNLINIDRNDGTIHKVAQNDSIECDGGSVTYEYVDSTWVVVS